MREVVLSRPGRGAAAGLAGAVRCWVRGAARGSAGHQGADLFNLSAVITAVRSRPRGPAARGPRDCALSARGSYVIFSFRVRVETAVRHRRSRGREPENRENTRGRDPRSPAVRIPLRTGCASSLDVTPPELDKPTSLFNFIFIGETPATGY